MRRAPFGFSQVVFLSHVIGDGAPVFPGDPPVEIRPVATIERDGYYMQSLTVGEQAGHTGPRPHISIPARPPRTNWIPVTSSIPRPWE